MFLLQLGRGFGPGLFCKGNRMTRLSIEVTAPASDDFMEQARVLLGAKPEIDALVAKLKELGVAAHSRGRFITEHERKPKAAAAPAAQPAAEGDSVTLPPATTHGRRHGQAAAAD